MLALELHLADSLSAAATDGTSDHLQCSRKLGCLPWVASPDGIPEQIAQVVAPNSICLSSSWQLGQVLSPSFSLSVPEDIFTSSQLYVRVADSKVEKDYHAALARITKGSVPGKETAP